MEARGERGAPIGWEPEALKKLEEFTQSRRRETFPVAAPAQGESETERDRFSMEPPLLACLQGMGERVAEVEESARPPLPFICRDDLRFDPDKVEQELLRGQRWCIRR